MTDTKPIDSNEDSTAPLLAIAPAFRDDRTGALYIHNDLHPVSPDWRHEEHVGPIKVVERFGDVESWASYVTRYHEGNTLAAWNSTGLRAVLDYHVSSDSPGRAQWIAVHDFERTPQWQTWTRFANGEAVSQKKAIDTLEDLSPDIVKPSQADLVDLLRNMRTSINSTAQTELKADGSSHVSFVENKSIKGAGGGTANLPSEIEIGVQVLKGHVNSKGEPVRYTFAVKLRASVDDGGRLALRFSIPLAERVLETVFAARVKDAQEEIGSNIALMRAAG